MTREQAINYLFSCGFTNEQVGDVVRALTYEPTTKNDLTGDIMEFPKTFDEFVNFYGFKDKDEVYTNGSELIPVFRVKQWLEHISTTKNNLGVDCISRESVLELLNDYRDKHFENSKEYPINYGTLLDILRWIRNLPSVTPQLSVPEVTSLAEWISKLTEECEVAYNKGYADGMKAQAEPKIKIEESNFSREQYVLDTNTAWKCGYEAGKKENAPVNICPFCGEYIGEEE